MSAYDSEETYMVSPGDTVRVPKSGFSTGSWGMVAAVSRSGVYVVFRHALKPSHYNWKYPVFVTWEEIIEV